MKKVKGLILKNNQIIGVNKDILKFDYFNNLKITDKEFEENYYFILEMVKNFFEAKNNWNNISDYYIIERDQRQRLIPVLKSVKNKDYILNQYVLNGMHDDLLGDVFLDGDYFINFEVDKEKHGEKTYTQMFARQEIFKFLLKTFENYKENRYEKLTSIYISGSREIGKTFLINLLTNSLIRDLQKTVAFIDVYLFMNNIIKTFQSNNSDEIKDNIIKLLIDADLVVFDNLGKEKFASWFHSEILWKIISARSKQNKQTILLSNFDVKTDELQKKYLSKSDFKNEIYIKKEIDEFIDLIKTSTNWQINILGENMLKFLKKI